MGAGRSERAADHGLCQADLWAVLAASHEGAALPNSTEFPDLPRRIVDTISLRVPGADRQDASGSPDIGTLNNNALKGRVLLEWNQHPAYHRTMPLEAEISTAAPGDQTGAHAEARSGGLVGHWRFEKGHFDIVRARAGLRIVLFSDGAASYGDLSLDDIWYNASLTNGVAIRLRCDDAQQLHLLVNVREDTSWSEDLTARLLDKHELVACRVLKPEVTSLVRKLAEGWSVTAKGPPADLCMELQGRPHPLSQLTGAACAQRQAFLEMCLELSIQHLPKSGSALVYASHGSNGQLWFDWWLLEALLAKGYCIGGAHFVDPLYHEGRVRNSGMKVSPLGDMAAWLRACGMRSFAYPSQQEFGRQVAGGAHILVQCNPQGSAEDVHSALCDNGGLLFRLEPGGNPSARMRKSGEVLPLSNV